MLKGKARIELTNVETGEKQVIREENMVTNALNTLFSIPHKALVWGNASNTHSSRVAMQAMPIYEKALGGILLFEESLPEDPNIIYSEMANAKLVGNAGGVYAGPNIHRGNYNAVESVEIENGYRHVWDFSTDKVNGKIGCVCLTSLIAGNNSFTKESDISSITVADSGSPYNGINLTTPSSDGMAYVFASPYDYFINGSSAYQREHPNHILKITCDDDRLYLYCAGGLSSNLTVPEADRRKIVVYKIKGSNYSNLDILKASDQTSQTDVRNCDYEMIKLEPLKASNHVVGYENFSVWCLYMKDENTIAATWCKDTSNLTNKSIRHMEFDLNGVVKKDILITLSLENFNLYQCKSVKYDGKYFIAVEYSSPYRTVRFDENGNVVDILTFPMNNTSGVQSGWYDYESGYFVYCAGVDTSNNFIKMYFIKDGEIKYTGTNYYSGGGHTGCCDELSLFPYTIKRIHSYSNSSGYNSYFTFYMGLRTNYLATINNLAAPVTKTSAQTMKITYEITQD